MKTKLIIIRGNSGSGKTTTAKSLQQHFGQGTLLVSQDVIRRDMLKVPDREGNLSIDLMRQIAQYGKGKCDVVIVEGILNKKRYGDMLKQLIAFFEGNAYVYYFDLSFEETVNRHNTKDKRLNFGVEALRDWWNPHDVLGVDGEHLLTDDMSQTDAVQLIISHLCNDVLKGTL